MEGTWGRRLVVAREHSSTWFVGRVSAGGLDEFWNLRLPRRAMLSVFQDDVSAKHAAFSASHSDLFQFLQNNVGPFETFSICSQNLCK